LKQQDDKGEPPDIHKQTMSICECYGKPLFEY